MRTGIMGGTFDPPHTGHLHAAVSAKEMIPLDRLILIPAGIPPHKQMAENSASVDERLEMTRLAAESIGAEVSDVEIRREGKSFTVDTLKHFRSIYPDDELWLIVGTDMFLTIEAWREAETILKTTCIAAVPRNNGDIPALSAHAERLKNKYGTRSRIIEVAAMEISSTELRPDAGGANSAKHLPAKVREYIEEHGLYGASEGDKV